MKLDLVLRESTNKRLTISVTNELFTIRQMRGFTRKMIFCIPTKNFSSFEILDIVASIAKVSKSVHLYLFNEGSTSPAEEFNLKLFQGEENEFECCFSNVQYINIKDRGIDIQCQEEVYSISFPTLKKREVIQSVLLLQKMQKLVIPTIV